MQLGLGYMAPLYASVHGHLGRFLEASDRVLGWNSTKSALVACSL